ncbi:MAG: manganese efflux pump [Clostridia bacterium]|jgi:putative Mn2+ efflux pump MntP|nr:manganese efflux pump [Clostridia bacterium]
MDIMFFVTAILLGVGLAMDAFSVSLANGLNESRMKVGKMNLVSGVFAFFQALMPLIGWFFVHTLVEYFKMFEKFIPWIALILLAFIGGKMLIEGIKNDCEECEASRLSVGMLLVQGIATSIDALSVGFTISGHNFIEALITALIIAAVTYGICFAGIIIGKRFGTRLKNKASILGGVILILIGIEIFITGII